jgi:hypothetical protein
MAGLAINLLWFLVYLIIFVGVVALVIYGINEFVYTMPPLLVRGIWFVVLLIAIIYAITVLTGGGGVSHPNFH